MDGKGRENGQVHYSQERQKPKDFYGGDFKDMLTRILNKVMGYDKCIKYMKDNISSIIYTLTSHSIAIN